MLPLKQLFKKHWYWLAMSLMGVTLVINLLGGFQRVAGWLAENIAAENGPQDDQWQAWLDRNSLLFKPLSSGAKIGITLSQENSDGVIITKTDKGLIAFSTRHMKRELPGVIMVLDSLGTVELLQSHMNSLKSIYFISNQARLGRIQAFRMHDMEQLRKHGYLAFLNTIGLSAN
ncbi:MAG: hypothetical protein IIA59_04700 [Candidatus Marinimicrobia bacterium]|nr:hypothetical protein [Candidatus Neomarinimicrobiota bacterium]